MIFADKLIEKFDLKKHPEGGYFKETYRSQGSIGQNNLGSKYSGTRNYSTCIYFLLPFDGFSAFHRIKQDEIWHFYKGSPIWLHTISEAGDYSKTVIGNDFEKGEIPQFVVPGGKWFAAEVADESGYSFMGCTVSPGFDFEDFELADRGELISKFPKYEKIITKLTLS